MDQVSVEYVQGDGEKVGKPQMGRTEIDGWTDGQTESKPLVLSVESDRGIITALPSTASTLMVGFWPPYQVVEVAKATP